MRPPLLIPLTVTTYSLCKVKQIASCEPVFRLVLNCVIIQIYGFSDDLLNIILGEIRVGYNSSYSNPGNVKGVEYPKLLLSFVSLGGPLVAIERDIFKMTKRYLMSEKIEPK